MEPQDDQVDAPPPPTESVKAYQRRVRYASAADDADEGGLRFDDTVAVHVIEVPNPALEGLTEADYEVIGEKITYRLAQRPGAYVVLKYVHKAIKRQEADALSCPPAPPAVFEKSLADVSLLAGLVIDKFCYYLPLYRQHQRLAQAGIPLSRATLTHWVHRTADLLEPIYHALLSSILQSQVLTMEETPIKAGHKTRGKLQTSYFWPLYGDQDEIAFPFAASRAERVVREALGSFCGVLVTDGYKVYDRFVRSMQDIVHAQGWAHTRRKFVDAQAVEPGLVAQALERIGSLYTHEAESRERQLSDEAQWRSRSERSRPVVEEFFTWLEGTLSQQVLLPSNPFRQAALYALERRAALSVFLADPTVPLDTNHLEREIRAIALGRKNWLFCWTEIGARYVGILQSLLASCRLQRVDP